MCVLLRVRNQITPRADLRAHIEKLRDHRQHEMPLTKELEEVSMLAVFGFALDAGKLRPPDQKGPKKRYRRNHYIRMDNAQRFKPQVRLIGSAGHSIRDLGFGKF